MNGSEEFKLGVTMNADMKGIIRALIIYFDIKFDPSRVLPPIST